MFGILQREFTNLPMVVGQSGEFKPYHLLIFSETIVFLENKTLQDETKETNWLGMKRRKIGQKIIEKRYSCCFELKDIHTITSKYIKPTGHVVEAKTFTELKLDKDKSFKIKVGSPDEATELVAQLKSFTEEAKKLQDIQHSLFHKGHDFERYRATELRFGDNIKTRCGACGDLMLGLLFTGVRCKTCQKIFHFDCFSNEEKEEDIECGDPIDLLIKKKDNLKLNDFNVGAMNKEKCLAQIWEKEEGTFLLRYSREKEKYELIVKSCKEEQNKSNILISLLKCVEIHGEPYFYIEKGTSAKSPLALIQKCRRSHQLFIPFNLSGSDEEDENEENQILNTDGDENIQLTYFFGDITRIEAEHKLIEKDKGTFLLRTDGDTFKVSWKTFNDAMRHVIIGEENGMFSILPQHSFPSIDSLLMFHRSLDRGHRMALGNPLANSGLTEYETNDKIEKHKEKELIAGKTNQSSDLTNLVDEVRSLKSAVALLLDKVQEIDIKITKLEQ